jgi:hypothetical protein
VRACMLVRTVNANEIVLIIFGVLFVVTVAVAPWLAAEGRPEFLRPDLKHTHRWDGPMKDV